MNALYVQITESIIPLALKTRIKGRIQGRILRQVENGGC